MKSNLIIAMLFMSSPALAAWKSDLANDVNTHERVGYAALEHEQSAISVGCQENAGLVVSFYWTVDLHPNAAMEIQIDDGDVLSPESLLFTPSNSTYPASPTVSVELIREFRTGSRLTVSVKMNDGSMSPTETYDLNGFTQQFQKVCDWHPAYSLIVS